MGRRIPKCCGDGKSSEIWASLQSKPGTYICNFWNVGIVLPRTGVPTDGKGKNNNLETVKGVSGPDTVA